MRNAYFDQLDAIVDDLVAMTRDVQQAVSRATHALLTADGHIADQVVAGDARIDAMREQVEDRAFELLALIVATNPSQRQSFATDQTWWFRELRRDPRYKTLTGSAS